jgi:hypothetical protein
MNISIMKRVLRIATVCVLSTHSALAEELAGTMTLTIDGEARPFVLVQGTEGANPGSRYSRLGEDLIMTIVGVLGRELQAPDEAAAVIELRFTIDSTAPEVRSGSVLSYSTRDNEGKPSTRGGTAEISLDALNSHEQGVDASGSFTAELPPDQESPGGQIEGRFHTKMAARDTRP